MSSILNQLIRWEACFADREQTSPTKSLRVDFTIEGDDEEDEGDNDGDVEKELITVWVDVGLPTDLFGEEMMAFLFGSNKIMWSERRRIMFRDDNIEINVAGWRVATETSK